MVASDATLWRVLPMVDSQELRRELRQANVLLRQQGHGQIELPGGRRIRAAAIDGTVQGGQHCSFLEMLGEHAALLDFEPSSGMGHELATSERLLKRFARAYRSRFVDIVLADGLYANQGFFRTCTETLNAHALVKCKGSESDRFLMFQDAEKLFHLPEASAEVEFAKGTDADRGMSYQIHAAKGFHHDGYKGELKVAKMRIKMFRGPEKGQVQTWWIVTTDLSLTAVQMRELAHRRWSIENDAFRAMNAHMNSKHIWARGKNAKKTNKVLMLLMALAFTLLLAYRASLDQKELWEDRRLRRVPVGYVAECLLMSLSAAAGAFSPGD
jgi:hypothetical protein